MDIQLNIKEGVSALFDGECTAEEIDILLDEMNRSPELKAQWDRLSLIRAAQNNVPVGRLDHGFAARVMASLVGVEFDSEEEPAQILMPPPAMVEVAGPALAEIATAKVIPFPRPTPQPRKNRQPLFAMAAAASLAMVAVVTHFEKPDAVVAEPGSQVASIDRFNLRPSATATGERTGLLATAYRPTLDSTSGGLSSMRISSRGDDDSALNQSFDDYIIAHEAGRMRFNNAISSNFHAVDYQQNAQR